MSEENKTIELNDENFQDVTGGGKNDKDKCPMYQYKSNYMTCPNSLKGICKQCEYCNLNVD